MSARHRHHFKQLVVACLLVTTACESKKEDLNRAQQEGERGGNGVWTTRDEWHHPLPSDLHAADWKVVEPNRVIPLGPPAQFASAMKILETRSAVEVTDQAASELLGRAITHSEWLRPFVVRGVILNGRHGVQVKTHGDRVWVHHGTLGRRPLPMKRLPLLVLLPSEPKEVFVDCSMAE